MSLIITSVLSATDTKGTRIKAKSTHYGTSVTVPFDSGLSHQENHVEAVRALVRKMNQDEHAQFRGEWDSITLIGDAPGSRWVGYAFNVTSCVVPAQVWDV